MEEKKKSNKANLLVVWVLAFAVMIGLVALLLYNVFNQKETRTSTTKTDGEMGVLECQAAHPADALLADDSATSVTQKVKIILHDDYPGDVSYEYSGEFASEQAAETASSKMHATYNIYMGSEAEKLSPVFGVINNEVKISIYIEGGKLNSLNAKVVFLTADEMMEFYKLSKSTLEKLYQEKGFYCNYSKS